MQLDSISHLSEPEVEDFSKTIDEGSGMPTNDTLAAATSYQKLGWTPIRAHHPKFDEHRNVSCSCGKLNCRSPGKHPVDAWKIDQTSRPTKAQVHTWFNGQGVNNIALVHGDTSGTVLLDWDGPDGLNTRAMLEAEAGKLPPTVTVITPGGGEHQIFAFPGQKVPSRRGLLPGLDVRGDGGVSIAPPSLHYSGGRYTWAAGASPADLKPAVLPEIWVDLICHSLPKAGNDLSASRIETDKFYGEKITDGREQYMRDTTLAVLCV